MRVFYDIPPISRNDSAMFYLAFPMVAEVSAQNLIVPLVRVPDEIAWIAALYIALGIPLFQVRRAIESYYFGMRINRK